MANKIRFVHTCSDSYLTFRQGIEYDVTDDQAAEFLRCGLAVAVQPQAEPEPVASEPVSKKRK